MISWSQILAPKKLRPLVLVTPADRFGWWLKSKKPFRDHPRSGLAIQIENCRTRRRQLSRCGYGTLRPDPEPGLAARANTALTRRRSMAHLAPSLPYQLDVE